MSILALHGFLGDPQDFSEVCSAIQDYELTVPDYCRINELSPQQPLSEWGNQLNQWIHRSGCDSRILLGYSQGGRLALHAFFAQPNLFEVLILLSTQVGLSVEARPARLQNDLQWAERFRTDPFEQVLQAWNSQPVFNQSRVEPNRRHLEGEREMLALCLSNWSVGRQKDFRQKLASVSKPILYLAGEYDQKYCRLGEELEKLNSAVHFQMIEKAGHRILLDQPVAVAQAIEGFLKKRPRFWSH